MDVKWFFVIVGIFLTFAILLGMYAIGSYLALQEQQSNQGAVNRFDNSSTVHKFIFDNITSLKERLDPILALIPNATKANIDQQVHYNQTATDFEKIKQVLEIKLQDHKTLGQVNQTVNEILRIIQGNNNTNPIVENVTPPAPAPGPLPAPSNNTDDIIIENVTKDNSTSENGTILILKK